MFNFHKHEEFLDHLCNCEPLRWLLRIVEVIGNVSVERKSMNFSQFLWPLVLFCCALWPISTTSKQWLLFCVVAIDSAGGYLLGNTGW